MNLRLSRVALAFGAGTIAFGLAACGSDNPVAQNEGDTSTGMAEGTTLSGSVAGAGASSQEAAMNAWIAKYQAQQQGVTVSYDPVGSGAGITQFVGKQVAWAGSDAVLKDDEVTAAKERCGSDALNLPVYISPVAVIFNLEGVDSLNMDAETIAKVFSGEITKWNDEAIASQNPDVELPDLAITPVHRSDKSGTTENFTSYLHEAAGDVWTDEADKTWPIAGGETGDKTSGLIQAVQSTEGTIGYADFSKAGDDLGIASLKSGDGYTAPSQETAAKAADIAEPAKDRADGDLALDVVRVPKEEGAYPLIMISYEIVCSKYEKEEGDLVKAFMEYVSSKEGQKAAAESAGSAPISDEMRQKVQKSLDKIKIG